MSVDERHELYEKLEAALGADAARTLMSALPPPSLPVASRAELEVSMAEFRYAMREEMDAFRTEMRAEMVAFKTEIRQDMDAFRTEIREGQVAFRTEMRQEMADFKAEMRQEMADFKTEIRDEMALNFRRLVLANLATVLTATGLAFTAARF